MRYVIGGNGGGQGRGRGLGRGMGRGRGMGYGRGMGLGRGVGIANYGVHSNMVATHSQATSKKAYVEKDLCVGCGVCANVCRTGAISIVNRVAEVDINKCIGCDDCVNVCPRNAIALRSIEEL